MELVCLDKNPFPNVYNSIVLDYIETDNENSKLSFMFYP